MGPIMGLGAGLVWRGFETWSQISFRNQVRRVTPCWQPACSRAAASARSTVTDACVFMACGPVDCQAHPLRLLPCAAAHVLQLLAASLLGLPLQILVATDWARTKIFGRDTSRV